MELKVKTIPKLIGIGLSVAAGYPFLNMALYPIYRDDKPRPERTVIVTGASGNLGTSITYQLARRQVRVIMACRNMEKCKMIRRELVLMTGNKGIVCRKIDLEDIDSINKFADEMIKTEPHIDVLVNNATVRDLHTKQLTKYGVEKSYFVNYLAPFLLTFRLMDKLKKSAEVTKDSRIINITDTPKKSWNRVDVEDINFDKRKYSGREAYRQSKLALAYFTQLLDRQMRENRQDVYVYAIDIAPRWIYKSLYHPISIVEQFKAIWTSYYQHNPDRVIQNVIKAGLDSRCRQRSHTGGHGVWSYVGYRFKWKGPASDEMEAKRVWNTTARFYHQLLDDSPPKTIATTTKSTTSNENIEQPGGHDGGAMEAVTTNQEQKKA